MAELELTEQQREAVGRRDRSVFLRAGAGTGKTAVLVERFVRLVLEDETGVEHLLAITFTDKAAAELGERVRTRFVEEGRRDLARASEAAWISTFHGLCSRILRAHSLAAGIDPDYKVLDAAEAGRLAADAFDLALGDFLADPGQDRLDLAAGYTPAKLERMVGTVYARLRSMGQAAPALPEIERPRDPPDPAALDAAAMAVYAELEPQADGGKMVAAAAERAGDCRDAVAELADGRTAAIADFESLEIKTGRAGALQVECVEAYNAALNRWLGELRAVKAYADYQLLSELLGRYGDRYERLKRERSGLDFDDLELRVRDLLEADAGLREHYRERFESVMVDEFQDVNALQERLLELLVPPERLFTVGDERQSIYLFRHADVSLFAKRADAAEDAGELLRLSVNFRSSPAVLAVLNRCWDKAFLEGSFDRLEPGREQPADGTAPRVELLLTDNSKKRWDTHFEGEGNAHPEGDGQAGEAAPFGAALAGATVWRAAEARLLALRLRTLLDGGSYAPGDVAVLVRATTEMHVYEQALEAAGVPTYLVGGRGYWRRQQVLDLRSYLAALANPRDGQALLSVLASPLCGVSLDGLALAGRRARHLGGLWRALELAFGTEEGGGDAAGAGAWAGALGEDDRRRLESFVERFARERSTAPQLSLERLVDRAVTDSGYDLAILATPRGERRLANVRKLMRLAREYEADEGRDLRGFIDFLDLQGEFEVREGEAPLETESVGAVRLMTIHAAKGLEFPVVCIADLGRSGKGDEQDPLQVSDDGRVGLNLQSLGGPEGEALDLAEIKERQKLRYDAEERRIFYVAMTRARERLIVSGAADLEKRPNPDPLGIPMDWVWRALAPEAEDAGGARFAAEGVEVTLLSPATVDEVLAPEHRDPEAPRPRDEDADECQPPSFDAVEVEEPLRISRLSYSSLGAYERCGYRFYLEKALGLPDPEASASRATPGADDEKPHLDGLLRGSIVHELLERLDFAHPGVPAADEVAQRIRADGVEPSDDEVEGVRALVEGFAASPLCDRLGRCSDLRAELPFAFTLDPATGRSLLVNGIVDVRAREGDLTLVVDYKSDRLGDRSPQELVDARYSTQRGIYGLAALREGAERVEVVYSFLERPDEPVATVYTQADAERLERELLALAAGVIAGEFPVSEHPNRDLCSGCPGEGGLCSWPLERTRAERDAA